MELNISGSSAPAHYILFLVDDSLEHSLMCGTANAKQIDGPRNHKLSRSVARQNVSGLQESGVRVGMSPVLL